MTSWRWSLSIHCSLLMIWRSLTRLPHMKILKDCNYAFPQLWIGVLGTVCLWILASAQVVHFSSNKVSSHQSIFYLSIQIPAVLITKDLGVHFSSTATWTLQHISAISVTRPMKCLGLYLVYPEVLKAQLLFNPPLPRNCSLVRQLVEYASPPQSPYEKVRLEALQRRFSRLVGVRLGYGDLTWLT